MPSVAKKKAAALEGDPLDITPRLYKQLDRLLDDMEAADRDERMTMPQRITGMIALGRIMKMMQDIRRGDLSVGAGSAVQRYAAAFAPASNATRGGKPIGTGVIVEFDRPDGDLDPYNDLND